MDRESNWAYPCDIFTGYYVVMEGNKPSHLKPSWSPHNHGSGYIRSATRGFLEVDVIGRCIDEPLFTSALLLAFVYAMLRLSSEHSQSSHTGGIIEVGGGRTNQA